VRSHSPIPPQTDWRSNTAPTSPRLEPRFGDNLGATTIGAVTGSVLLLSAAGLYALMSFTVAQRRREIGIRSALGAPPGQLVAAVFRRAFWQIGAGSGRSHHRKLGWRDSEQRANEPGLVVAEQQGAVAVVGNEAVDRNPVIAAQSIDARVGPQRSDRFPAWRWVLWPD